MRWILLCLVIFNVLYFGWVQYSRDFQPQTPVSEPSEAQQSPLLGARLILLKETRPAAGSDAPPPTINFAKSSSEVAPAASPEMVPPASHERAPPASPKIQSPASAVVAEAFEVVDPEIEGQPEAVFNDGVTDEVTHSIQSPGGTVEAAEDLVSVIPSGEEAQRIASPSQNAKSEAVVTPATAVSGDRATKLTKVCAKLGPFEEKAYAESLLENLIAEDVAPALREQAVLVNTDSWVVIPPLGSRKDALKVLRRLQSNKIDSYLITEGDFANGISLGLFKRSASAQGVLEKMLAAGYDVQIEKIDRLKAQFWVGFSGEFEAPKVQAMLAQLVEDSGKINFSETLCEMFASTP